MPSGDHAGWLPLAIVVVETQLATAHVTTVPALVYAMCVPSGDQLGSEPATRVESTPAGYVTMWMLAPLT